MPETNQGASPDPFFLNGGSTGVLLLHGFTGSPAEVRPVGQVLHEKGLTVFGPLLPGHGTTPADLNRRKREDWLAAAEEALADLERRCETVFVGGLSMGSVLAMHLALSRPDLAGLLAYAPAIGAKDWRRFLAPILCRVMPFVSKPASYSADPEADARMWHYDVYPSFAAQEVLRLMDETRAAVHRISVPTLVVYTEADPTVTPSGGQFVYDQVQSADKDLLVLQESGHCVTADAQYQEVAERTWAFIEARL